ncbi:hypothetical protein V8G54_034838 [Vigna mungo]|uniref:Uncharacterized protein n=1 Tax=Vigna mungo TaxID=3915 RepID=A0AAQ3MFE3_VIGMU
MTGAVSLPPLTLSLGFEVEIEGGVEVESDGGEEVYGGVEVDRDNGLEVETNGGEEMDGGVEVDKDGGQRWWTGGVTIAIFLFIFGLEFPVCRLGISIQFLLNGGEAQRMVCVDDGDGDMVA